MIPDIEITENGIVAPTTDEVLAGVWEMLKTAFGSNLNTAMNTPQGQLATSITAVIQNERNKWIQLMNQIDPQYSTGIWQDAIGELYFLTRQMATKSTAQVVFYGLHLVTIPMGYQVQDQAGIIWETIQSYIIQPNGEANGVVECQEFGSISAAPNTITQIINALVGVDRVENPDAAIIGRDSENPSDFESRRSDSVAANAKNTDSSVRGAVANISGVVDVFVKSNPEPTTQNTGSTNYPIDRNSILVSVVGGIDSEIANQILIKAGSGCGFTGNTTVTLVDNDAHAITPPTYDIKFLRPDNVTVKFKVTFQDASKLSFQDSQAIKNSILNALTSGASRARIGQNLRAVQYVSAVTAATNLDLISIEVGTDGIVWLDKIELGVDQFPVSSISDIEVV